MANCDKICWVSYEKNYKKKRIDNWIGVPIGDGKLSWFPTLRTMTRVLHAEGRDVILNEAGKKAFFEEYGYHYHLRDRD